MKGPVRLGGRFALLLSLLGVMTGVGMVPAAAAVEEVSNYGRCVKFGIDPTSGLSAPMLVVVNSAQVIVVIPHQSVDGNPPPAFAGGWSACQVLPSSNG